MMKFFIAYQAIANLILVEVVWSSIRAQKVFILRQMCCSTRVRAIYRCIVSWDKLFSATFAYIFIHVYNYLQILKAISGGVN